MRFYVLGLAAALCLVGTAPSYAKGYSGYYLATFKYPGGTFQHCFALTQDNSVSGYAASGSWTVTDFANTAGQFVVFQRTIHLAGYVGDPNGTYYLAIDGQVAGGTLHLGHVRLLHAERDLPGGRIAYRNARPRV